MGGLLLWVYDKISFFGLFSRVCRTISTFIYLKVTFYHYKEVLLYSFPSIANLEYSLYIYFKGV